MCDEVPAHGMGQGAPTRQETESNKGGRMIDWKAAADGLESLEQRAEANRKAWEAYHQEAAVEKLRAQARRFRKGEL